MLQNRLSVMRVGEMDKSLTSSFDEIILTIHYSDTLSFSTTKWCVGDMSQMLDILSNICLTKCKDCFTLYQVNLHKGCPMKMDRKYLARFIPGMLLYMVLLPFCVGIAKVLPEDNLLRYPIAVLPVLPIGFVFWALIDHVRGLDELEQRIHLEAAVFSLGATGMIFFAMGLLESTGLKTLHIILVLPSNILFWGVGGILARRRYK
jgi:hypothetical protein